MSEFLDFLKHKYAYVVVGEFKPGKFAEAQYLDEQAVSTYKEGFKKAYLFQKPDTDEGIAVIIWNSIEDMEANKTEANQAIIEKIGPLFAKPPVAHFYQLSTEISGKD